MILSGGQNHHICACCELCTFAHGCSYGLSEDAHIDRTTCGGTGSAGRKRCHGDDLLDIALGQHLKLAVRSCELGVIASACLGLALADQHTDGACCTCLGNRAGGGGQNIDEIFFALSPDCHILCCANDSTRPCLGIGFISANRCRKGSACRQAVARCVQGGGNENQIRTVLCQNADTALFRGEICIIAHGSIDFVSCENHIHRAANGRCF